MRWGRFPWVILFVSILAWFGVTRRERRKEGGLDPSGGAPGFCYCGGDDAPAAPVEPTPYAHENPVGSAVGGAAHKSVGEKSPQKDGHGDVHPQFAPVDDEDSGPQSGEENDRGQGVQEVISQAFRAKHCAESPVRLEQ